MSGTENLSGLVYGGVALVALGVAGYFRLVLAAFNSLTRAEALESAKSSPSRRILVKLVEKRAEVYAAARSLRIFFIIVFTLMLTLALDTFLPENGYLVVSVLLIAIGCFASLSLLIPTHLGIKKSVPMLIPAARLLLWGAKFTAVFVRRSEPNDEEEKEDEDENRLVMMVERVAESNALDEEERSLLQSVFQLSETLVREVMVPRTDMIHIKKDHSLDKALSLFARSGFSRVPVVGDSVDELCGVLYLKDIICRIHHRSNPRDISVAEVMREPTFVPETMTVDVCLHNMQKLAIHIALVVDEYGGIAGLVTIEDLLEELVGEMVDEHDRALPEIEPLSEDSYRVPARLPLDDLGELFNLDISDDDVDTIGGLFAKVLGRVPIAGSATETHGLHLQADRFEGRRKRIASIIVSRAESESDAE